MAEGNKNIARKLMEVGRKVERVAKSSSAGGGLKYKFVSHDSVTEACADPLAEAGIYYYPDTEQNSTVPYETPDGKYIFYTEVTIRLYFIDTETGETISFRSCGVGIDPSDKSVGKAISYAVKYGLLKGLGLATGDDPENDNHQVKAKPPTASNDNGTIDLVAQRNFYQMCIKDLGMSRPEIQKRLEGMNLAGAGAIPANKLDEIISAMRNMKGAA
jgi:hypothetical protein